MTINRRAKQLARAEQRDSGLPYTESRRASALQWDAGTTPWARGTDSAGRKRRMVCLFCGEKSSYLAYGDNDADSGRLELYCDNGLCDAREMTVIVMRDGADAIARPDVGALRDVDDPDRFGRPKVMGFRELLDSGPSPAELVERRRGKSNRGWTLAD